jgi:hypothetical protein
VLDVLLPRLGGWDFLAQAKAGQKAKPPSPNLGGLRDILGGQPIIPGAGG